MKLKLKIDAVNIPLDGYGVPCPDAYAKDTYAMFDYGEEKLIVGWAIFRNEAEAAIGKHPIQRGSYEWNKVARPSVYAPDILATYEPDVQEIREPVLDVDGNPTFDEEGKPITVIVQPFVKGKELTPLIKGELIIPKFGEFKDVLNISSTVEGTEFGEKGDMWIKLHKDWEDYDIVK